MSEKKVNHLDEVRLAAKYNYLKHKREQEENLRRIQAVKEGTLEELVEEEMALAQKANEPAAPSEKGK